MNYETTLTSSSTEFYDLIDTLAKERHAQTGEFKKLNSLLRQMSADQPEITPGSIFEFYEAGGAIALATHKKTLVGIACLVLTTKINGISGRIEDVVVDSKHRGHGLAKSMMEKLIEAARESGLSHLDLTTAPERKVANHLYQGLGFVQGKTNVYRLVL